MNTESRKSRACESCRHLKTQCERDEKNPSAPCRRCAKSERQCFTSEPVRKHNRKPESRIEELEKRIEALTASLEVNRASAGRTLNVTGPNARGPAEQPQQSRGPERDWRRYGHSQNEIGYWDSPSIVSPGSAGKKRKLAGLDQSNPVSDDPSPGTAGQLAAAAIETSQLASQKLVEAMIPDVVDQGIVDLAMATEMFNRYKYEMSEMLPIVRFPASTGAMEIRRTKPILFLAILAVSSGTFRPDIQPFLVGEIYKVLADRIVCRGEKTIELLQALQVTTLWYQPIENYEELNFNQLIHMSAIMGIDIGMGRRTKNYRRAKWMDSMSTRYANPDPSDPETRRAWMGCYYACTSATMSLRTPLLVRWSPYLDDCLDVMAKSPEALPSDKMLSHLVKAQRIAENVAFQFSMDDPTAGISITDSKTQYHMKAFERDLDEWRRSVAEDSSNGELPPEGKECAQLMIEVMIKHTDGIISLYMHEIAMHHNHNIDEFKPAYGLDLDQPQEPDFITPAHIDSLSLSINAIHRALDAFLSLDVKGGQSFPTLSFGRTSYAVVALLKIHSILSSNNSTFGGCFKPEDLRVKYYLDTIPDFLQRVAQDNKCRVAQKFGIIMGVLSRWHAKRASWAQRSASAQPSQSTSRYGTPTFADKPGQRNSNAPTSEEQSLRTYDSMIGDATITNIGPEIDSFEFTGDELKALGDLIEMDPSWMNFDVDQNAWSF